MALLKTHNICETYVKHEGGITMRIEVTEENITKLLAYETIGANGKEERFNRWTKGEKDRLYINNAAFGLREWYTKSTGFHHASLNNLSGVQSRRYISCKNYIDLVTGQVVSENMLNWSYNFKEELEDLVECILAEE